MNVGSGFILAVALFCIAANADSYNFSYLHCFLSSLKTTLVLSLKKPPLKVSLITLFLTYSFKFRSANHTFVTLAFYRACIAKFVKILFLFVSARCNMYISRLCYDVSVCPSVRLSVTEVHWRIIANLGFKFRSYFTAHCGRHAARRAACVRIISRHASQC